jgi:aminopeptidase N
MSLLNRNSYEKGGFVLHMLRNEIGERAFFDALRAYYAKHKHATAVTDDLRAEMELAAGKSLAPFFDQWLKRPGYPSVRAEWSYDSAAHEVAVAVGQEGRFGSYSMPIDVAVTDSNGVVKRIRIPLPAAGATPATVRLPSATAPAAVILDPDVIALARFIVVKR